MRKPRRSPSGEGGSVSTSREPARIAGMFDAIAGRYDFLNHALSLGLDKRWRGRAVRELRLTGRERLLDLCTGTADLALAAAQAKSGAPRQIIGIDFAGEMLSIGLAKVNRAGLSGRVALARGDATRLPLADESVDAAMVGFGIRNVLDPRDAAVECHRVLRRGGRWAVLEFGMPRNRVVRSLYSLYFRFVLPRIGRLISRHGDAYSYLPASVAQFPEPDEFARILRSAGFSSVRHISLTLGTVYLYIAEK